MTHNLPFDRSRAAGQARVHRERGAATLIIVMVLFFIMSMVAAYTNRNLIFEQRTSANQYRSTQALEAADAGLQWALGLLNSGRVAADCRPSTNLADTSFRQRYLTIDDATGAVTPKLTSALTTLLPSCVFDGTNWQCSCPVDSGPAVTAPSGTGVFPAFRLRFMSNPARPTLVRIEVNSCTRYDDTCLNFPPQGADNEGRASVSALLALKGAISTEPVAALTVRGTLDVGGAALAAYNTDPRGSGVTIQAGGVVNRTNLQLHSTPGSPGDASVVETDPSFLTMTTGDRMFESTFGMRKATYRDQPASVVLACGLGGCAAADVRTKASLNPGLVLWIPGDLNIDTAGDIGSAAEPVALVVAGNVQFATPVNIYGLIYTQAANWDSGSGSGQVQGAMVAEGNVTGSSTAAFVQDAAIVTRLRTTAGSFVMVPGSWKDFP